MFEEKDIIYKYTRQDALNDGLLVSLKNYSNDTRLYKYPIAVTKAVWDIISQQPSAGACIWDLCWMSQKMGKKIDDSTVIFPTIIIHNGEEKTLLFKLQVHPGDNMEPVITIMLPDES